MKLRDQAAYRGKQLNYQVVPVAGFFVEDAIPQNAEIEFLGSDGFVASIPALRVLNRDTGKAMAYLAIELPEKPWPMLGKGRGSAGPFYLVWLNPELSSVGPEWWPYKIKTIEVRPSLEEAYPQILPVSGSSPATKRGFRVFVESCFPCHPFNGQGRADVGPDLNLPRSPVEYFRLDMLRRFIREPQAVRSFTRAKMSGFSKELLSDRQLEDLLRYFSHMKAQRAQD